MVTLGRGDGVARLAFMHPITPEQWARVDGPHLARLPELIFNRLPLDTNLAVAGSRHLAALARLAVYPVGGEAEALRTLVASPPWKKLRALRITGPLAPEGVQHLASACRLKHLEELELTLGNPADPPGAVGVVVAMLGQLIRAFMGGIRLPLPTGPRWADFGPALEALAAAKWVRRLRRVRIASGDPRHALGALGARLYGTAEQGADVIPDAAVFALADALKRDKLETLVLPAAIVGPSTREALTTHLGRRVAFA